MSSRTPQAIRDRFQNETLEPSPPPISGLPEMGFLLRKSGRPEMGGGELGGELERGVLAPELDRLSLTPPSLALPHKEGGK